MKAPTLATSCAALPPVGEQSALGRPGGGFCCNHDCNQGRRCPQRTQRKYTCDELGVCQGEPDCTGLACHPVSLPPAQATRHPFAPGIIELAPLVDFEEPPTVLEEVACALVVLSGLGAAAAVAGFSLGYLPLPGWLG